MPIERLETILITYRFGGKALVVEGRRGSVFRSSCLCQAVNAAGVLVEIFLGGGLGFGGGVVADDFENGGVIGEASADGPVAAVDDAVFAEGVPERVECGAIEFHIRRRGVSAT